MNYRWGADVPLFTNILALWNPIGSGKNLSLLQVNIAASLGVSSTVLAELIFFTNIIGGTNINSNIIKYNPNSQNSIANIFAGGTLTLATVIDRRTISVNLAMPSYDIEFAQELEIPPGKGVCLVHESEYSTNLFYPYATFSWFE